MNRVRWQNLSRRRTYQTNVKKVLCCHSTSCSWSVFAVTVAIVEIETNVEHPKVGAVRCAGSCAMPFFDDIGYRLSSSFWNKANKRACKNPVFHIRVCVYIFLHVVDSVTYRWAASSMNKFHKHMLLDFLRKLDWEHKPLSSKIIECIIVGSKWIPGRHDVLWATQ